VAQFIYTLEKARKAHGDKVVLDDVTLSFLPGAKIGVVGPNGAGKSSLLKIMAGQDQPSNSVMRRVEHITRRTTAKPRLMRRKSRRRRSEGPEKLPLSAPLVAPLLSEAKKAVGMVSPRTLPYFQHFPTR